MHSTDATRFRCPVCRGPLTSTEGALRCAPCDTTFPDRDGIIDFRCRRYDYYFNPVPKNEMADLVRRAPETPWEGMVEHFLRFVPNASGWLDNIAINSRYAWKLMLPLRPGSRFLDLGCGLGNLSQNIAPHVGEVVALDLTWERLQFAQQRFAKFNRDDRITLVAGGDTAFLPFPDAHFDTIALSGVLEWIGDDPDVYAGAKTNVGRALRMVASFFGDKNPRAMQLRFLRELRRVLKPDGQLFVAIENRWCYQYFQGRPDHHTRLKYGSLVPRFFANLYSIARRRRPYRTYTYSFNGLRRLLSSAGFPYHECYGLTPGYSRLEEVVPAFTRQPFWKPKAIDDRGERLKRSAQFVPAFGMIATADASRPEPLLARLLHAVEAAHPKLRGIELHRCMLPGNETIELRGSAGGTGILLKIAVSESAKARESRGLRMLDALKENRNFARFVPLPAAHGVHEALSYWLESGIAGTPIASNELALSRAAAAAIVQKLFEALHGEDMPRIVVSPHAGDTVFTELVAQPLAKIAPACAGSRLGEGLAARLERVFVDASWRVAASHGDLTANHLLVEGDEVVKVVSWGNGTLQGLPILDAIGYVESTERRHDRRRTVPENVLRLARWEWSSPEELDFLRAMYRRFGIDVAAHEALCYLYWVHYMARQLDTTARFDADYISRNVRPMLAAPLLT